MVLIKVEKEHLIQEDNLDYEQFIEEAKLELELDMDSIVAAYNKNNIDVEKQILREECTHIQKKLVDEFNNPFYFMERTFIC